MGEVRAGIGVSVMTSDAETDEVGGSRPNAGRVDSGMVLHCTVALQHFRNHGRLRGDRFATAWRTPHRTSPGA